MRERMAWCVSAPTIGKRSMNAQWVGKWNVGPRAHPNDGLLDTYDVRLPVSQVLPVRQRLHHGAHLPHPGIKEGRTTAIQV